MKKKILTLSLFFYLLTLLQISFFPHFLRISLNFVLVAVFFFNLFAPPHSWFGIILAPIAGFFLDIFSENFFGYYILISLAIAIFIKFFFKKYVAVPIFKKI